MNKHNNYRGATNVPGIKGDKGRSCLIVLLIFGVLGYFAFQDFKPSSIEDFFDENDYIYNESTPVEEDYDYDFIDILEEETPAIRVPAYEPEPIPEPAFNFEINGEKVVKLPPAACRELLKQRLEIQKQLESQGIGDEILGFFLEEFDEQLKGC